MANAVADGKQFCFVIVLEEIGQSPRLAPGLRSMDSLRARRKLGRASFLPGSAVIAVATLVRRLFSEILAQKNDAAAGGLGVAHDGLKPLAVAGVPLLVFAQESIELLLGGEVADFAQHAAAALDDAGAFELRGHHLDAALRQSGCGHEVGDFCGGTLGTARKLA